MAKNTGILVAGITLLVLAGGGYGLYRYLKSRNEENEQPGGIMFDTPGIDANTGIPVHTDYSSLPTGSFPIAKGQKSKMVWILQWYLNCAKGAGLATDGNFGAKTEAALLKHLGQTSINNKNVLATYFAQHSAAACAQMAKAKFDTLGTANFMNFLTLS